MMDREGTGQLLAAERAELRREWGLLHTAEALVLGLGRTDEGFYVIVESAMERRVRGAGTTIVGALRDAREQLGLFDDGNGKLVYRGTAA